MRELETLSNVNIRDPSRDKNLPIMSVTGSINQNLFKGNYYLFAWAVSSSIAALLAGSTNCLQNMSTNKTLPSHNAYLLFNCDNNVYNCLVFFQFMSKYFLTA